MKYYKLIYCYEKLISNFLIEYQDEFMDDLTDEEKLEEAKNMEPCRYAWYEEGEIYSENENCEGNSVQVSKLVKLFPEDWLEITPN